jgi:hypothetical protein
MYSFNINDIGNIKNSPYQSDTIINNPSNLSSGNYIQPAQCFMLQI